MEVKKRDTSKKRESILMAAIAVFSEDGYDVASMDKIAEKASASKRTVYNHFPSKNELFHAVLVKYFNVYESNKDIKYSSKLSLEEQLLEYIDAELFVVKSETWNGLQRVLMSVMMHNPDLAEEVKEKYGNKESPFICWLNCAKADGVLEFETAEVALAIFEALVHGTLTLPIVMSCKPLPEEMEAVFKKEVVDTFLSRYGV